MYSLGAVAKYPNWYAAVHRHKTLEEHEMTWRSLGMVMLLWKRASHASNPVSILETNLPVLVIDMPCQHNSRILKGILWHYWKPGCAGHRSKHSVDIWFHAQAFFSGLTFILMCSWRFIWHDKYQCHCIRSLFAKQSCKTKYGTSWASKQWILNLLFKL